MDEIKTTRDTEFNFALDFPESYFGSGKYPMLTNNRKTRINKDQLNKDDQNQQILQLIDCFTLLKRTIS